MDRVCGRSAALAHSKGTSHWPRRLPNACTTYRATGRCGAHQRAPFRRWGDEATRKAFQQRSGKHRCHAPGTKLMAIAHKTRQHQGRSEGTTLPRIAASRRGTTHRVVDEAHGGNPSAAETEITHGENAMCSRAWQLAARTLETTCGTSTSPASKRHHQRRRKSNARTCRRTLHGHALLAKRLHGAGNCNRRQRRGARAKTAPAHRRTSTRRSKPSDRKRGAVCARVCARAGA